MMKSLLISLKMRKSVLLITLLGLCAWCALLIPIDRFFFKKNASFSIRFLYPSIANQTRWDIPPLASGQDKALHEILSQDFTYLTKGSHCYAFISQDQRYIMKLHRYPSHMRKFPWLNRLSYLFDAKRIRIKEYNLKQYAYYMDNYKKSFENLKEETGVILLHINRTDHFKKTITLIDKTKNRYRVNLDDVTFILQKRADLIYPTLHQYIANNEIGKAKEVISRILELNVNTCKKGYINNDPVLKRNYGLLKERAIFIDIGDLVMEQGINLPENYIPYLREITDDLYAWTAQAHPDLLAHYEKEMQRLQEL